MRAAIDDAAGRRDSRSDQGAGLDPLLAAQFPDVPRHEAWSGEARLALAVVEDAILTVRLAAGVETPRARRLAADAWAWLTSRDTRDAFAFENLCDYLGLNAGWLRSGLHLAVAGAVGLPAPTAPVRRRDGADRAAARPRAGRRSRASA